MKAILEAVDDLKRSLTVEGDKLKTLANIVHEQECYLNHTDGCGWYYESWDKPSYARNRYMKLARNKMQIADKLEKGLDELIDMEFTHLVLSRLRLS